MSRVLLSLGTVFLFALGAPATGQEPYPAKPLNLIVPFPPGGAADLAARPLARELAAIMRQPVVVQNRSGAGGAIGMAHVVTAPADGYTLLVTLPSISIVPEAASQMEKMGSPLAYMDASEFGVFWEQDARRIGDAIKRIGRIEKN